MAQVGWVNNFRAWSLKKQARLNRRKWQFLIAYMVQK